MRLRNTKGKRSRKQLSEGSTPKKSKQGDFCALKKAISKGRGNPGENSGFEKARILWDCLFLSYQGLKIGIN